MSPETINEMWSALKGVSVLFGLISMVGAATATIVLVKVKGFQSVKSVAELKDAFNTMTKEANATRLAVIQHGSDVCELRSDVKAMNHILGDYVEAVGKYSDRVEGEIHRVHDRLNVIEREGCAAGRKPGNGDGLGCVSR